MPTSANQIFITPNSTDLVSGGPQDFQALITALDASANGPLVTRVIAGTFALLPNAATQVLGTLYHCTDISCGFIRNAATSWTYLPFGQSQPPIGSMTSYVGSTDPIDADNVTRWLICDGRTINRTQYSACFANLGTTYGVGNGSTTFNIPNGQGNVSVGKSGSFALGTSGGEQNHVLASGEMPTHTHTDSGHTHTDSGHFHSITRSAGAQSQPPSIALGGGGALTTTGGLATLSINSAAAAITTGVAALQNTGSGTGHNNMQPYVVVNHIIRVL